MPYTLAPAMTTERWLYSICYDSRERWAVMPCILFNPCYMYDTRGRCVVSCASALTVSSLSTERPPFSCLMDGCSLKVDNARGACCQHCGDLCCLGVLQNNEEDEGVDVNGNDHNEDSETKEHLSRQPSDRSQRSRRYCASVAVCDGNRLLVWWQLIVILVGCFWWQLAVDCWTLKANYLSICLFLMAVSYLRWWSLVCDGSQLFVMAVSCL